MAFHDGAEKRLSFLLQLYKDEHVDEALTLCLSYIDSFAQWLFWPCGKSGEDFVNASIDFGGDTTIGLIHPLQAVREFRRMKNIWNDIAVKIEEIFPGPDFELLTKDQFIQKISNHLPSKFISMVTSELWRTTIASIAYFYFRNPSIHGFGGELNMSFSKTTYQGKQVLELNFDRLYNIAINLHSELRRRAETTIQWFGNDDIIHA